MQKRKQNKVKKLESIKGFLLFLATMLVTLFFMPAPLIIGINISQHFHTRLYIGFFIPLLILGEFLSIQIRAKLFKQLRPVRQIGNWRDLTVIYLAFAVFCIILFYPTQLGYDSIFAYGLSSLPAFVIAILVAYIFGSANLRLKIAILKNPKKLFRVKRVNPERQRKARGDLVMLLSALFSFLISFYLSVMFGIKIYFWLGVGVVDWIKIIIIIVLIISPFLISFIVSSVIWKFVTSFYLPTEKWLKWDKSSTPNIPVIAPVFNKISGLFLKWKIDRENKSPNI